MRLDALLDPDALDVAVADGFVARKDGPDGLALYNYTPKAQYARAWTPETVACRGLVVRDDGVIQSRPFSKFFNVGEHDGEFLPALPGEPFEVFEKLDGSLIVASSRNGDGVLLTSRGSFDSTQAKAARSLWAKRFADVAIPENETWCFELIAPWNRIVVDYGDRTDLVLLARLDNETGRDLPLPEWRGAVARTFDGLDDYDKIAARLSELGPDDEGYVLRFASGIRAKAKGDEYARLHRILTGVSARTIWEALATGAGVDELLDRVPDEFYAWVRSTADGLTAQYADIDAATVAKHGEIATLPTRKDQAFAIADFPYKSCVFRRLDGRPYGDQIWKMIRPAAERPFRTENDA